jgi:superfamily II DNA or RNA helicase
MSSKTYRYYQSEADEAIYNELLINNKCIVKMFCGTGKSLLMRNCKILQNNPFIVYVFPSLNLIDQFYNDYLIDFNNVLRISSDKGSTTNSTEIITYLNDKSIPTKIICITYQSFQLLLDNLNGLKINICVFDESHHVVGEVYQTFIFNNDVCEKQIFFTATPKNANGIVMYDRDHPETNMCGELVYDYSYLRGVNEGYLNPFEIRIDMFTENTNKSLYETISRTILASGNTRVLTFHADVNTDRDTSVRNFVNEKVFCQTFREILLNEFPDKFGYYKKVQMVALDASIPPDERKQIMNKFDKTPDNHVFVISSCETISEGIDTKNANMCVFVDPKSSYVKIIQNIGRIVRKIFGQDKPNSTVLIPCWVDKDKYIDCDGDKDKCDEVIRQDMSEGGNFNGILNVLSALRQEDEDLYDICLHYPDTFSPQEIENNLVKQGITILDEDMELKEVLDYFDLDVEEDKEFETEEELLMAVANGNDVCIEVHSISLEKTVEKYNSEGESGEIVRMYKEEDDGEDIYRPILMKESGEKRTKDKVDAPNKDKRLNLKVHSNPDVKVLWNVVDGLDLTKDICSCIINCEVVKYDQMEVAEGIVLRANKRDIEGKHKIPIMCCRNVNKQYSEEEKQEHDDATKLSSWKQYLNGKGTNKCLHDVEKYLDTYLIGWKNDKFEIKALKKVNEICERAKKREQYSKNLIPKQVCQKNDVEYLKEEIQEDVDARTLGGWKQSYNKKGKGKLYDKVKEVLDKNLPGWNVDLKSKALKQAEEIYERAKKRVQDSKNLIPKHLCQKNYIEYSEEEIQEDKDATKLSNWKYSLKNPESSNGMKCPKEVEDYLDLHLPGWSQELENKNIQDIDDIFERAKERKNLPARVCCDKNKKYSDEQIQEHNDAVKIKNIKYNKSKKNKILQDYLNQKLFEFKKNKTIISDDINDEEYIFEKKYTKSNAIHRQTLVLKNFESSEEKKVRTKNELSAYHQKYITMKSNTLSEHFKTNPEEFTNYHKCRDKNLETFKEGEKPHEIVCKLLDVFKTKKQKTVVDMGCGLAKIANHFACDKRFKFINYDHVSVAQNIEVCDISSMPLDDDTVDICIMCFALWGSNCADYIKEAYRVLETQGSLYLIDSTKRWSDKNIHGYIEEGVEGQKLKELLEVAGFKIIQQKIEKFCLFHCVKI